MIGFLQSNSETNRTTLLAMAKADFYGLMALRHSIAGNEAAAKEAEEKGVAALNAEHARMAGGEGTVEPAASVVELSADEDDDSDDGNS